MGLTNKCKTESKTVIHWLMPSPIDLYAITPGDRYYIIMEKGPDTQVLKFYNLSKSIVQLCWFVNQCFTSRFAFTNGNWNRFGLRKG